MNANLKKNLKNRIQGWLPKEPSFPNNQTKRAFNQKTKNPTKTETYASLLIVTFAVVLGTLGLLGILGLPSYAPYAAGALAPLIVVVWSVHLQKGRNQAEVKQEGSQNHED